MSNYELLNHNGWLYCINTKIQQVELTAASSSNSNIRIYSDYKLHIAIPISYFDTHTNAILDHLIHAVNQGIIPQFKILNIGNGFEIQKSLTDSRARLYNNPFTIYLFQDFDMAAIVQLCRELENLLQDVPPADRRFLSTADLPMAAHITFRQEKLNGEYIKISGANSADLKKLEIQGQASEQYQGLLSAMNSTVHSASSEESSEKAKEREIRNFYNVNYSFYQVVLNGSSSNQQKISAALALLNLVETDFKKETDKSVRENYIARAFKMTGRKYHPDRVKNIEYEDTKQKAQSIFVLCNQARDLLTQFLDGKIILEDDIKPVNKPQYEPMQTHRSYHDALSQIQICRDFVSSAQSSAKVPINQNWDIKYELNEGTSTDLVIYNPVMTSYQNPQIIWLPGYQAFYHLFLAKQLPARFDDAYLDNILSYFTTVEADPIAAKWLLERVLTDNKFIRAMDSISMLYLAKQATELGYVQIGKTEIEVIAYYYKHHPETFYGRRITNYFEKGTKYHKIDRQALEQIFTENQSNFVRMCQDGLAKLMEYIPVLLPIVLSRKILTKNLDRYFVEYNLLLPFFKQLEPIKYINHLQNIKHVTLVQIILGSCAFLPFLNRATLQECQEFVSQYQTTIPIWVNDEIDLELYSRSTKDKTNVLAVQIDQFKGFDGPLDPKKFILNAFMSGKYEIVYQLDQTALLWLASEPSIHWSTYFVIAHALIKLNALNDCDSYLRELATRIQIDSANLSTQALYALLLTRDQQIKQINQEWLTSTKASILDQYKQLLRGEDINIDELKHSIEQFDLNIQCQEALQEYEKELKHQFNQLMARVREGERSDSLKSHFESLKNQCDYLTQLTNRNLHTGVEWRYLSLINEDKTNILDELSYLHSILFDVRNCVYTYKYRDKYVRPDFEKYGLKKDDRFYDNLYSLYLVYDYLHLKHQFYEQFLTFTTEEIRPYGQPEVPYQFSDLKIYLKMFANRMLEQSSTNGRVKERVFDYDRSFLSNNMAVIQSIYQDLQLPVPSKIVSSLQIKPSTSKVSSKLTLTYQESPSTSVRMIKSDSKSDIDVDDVSAINETITNLNHELDSCVCFFRSRKQRKIQGLTNILNEASTRGFLDAIASERAQNSDLTKGFFSSRTAMLLTSLENKYSLKKP